MYRELDLLDTNLALRSDSSILAGVLTTVVTETTFALSTFGVVTTSTAAEARHCWKDFLGPALLAEGDEDLINFHPEH